MGKWEDHCLHPGSRAVTVCRGGPCSTIAVNALADLSTLTGKVGVSGEGQDSRVHCSGRTVTCFMLLGDDKSQGPSLYQRGGGNSLETVHQLWVGEVGR